MSKHTSGPWAFWSGYNAYDKIEAQVTAEDGDIVIASYNHLIAEGEANASLMAAAPDLLEALELLIGKAYKQNFNDAYPEILEKCESAMAKARGET